MSGDGGKRERGEKGRERKGMRTVGTGNDDSGKRKEGNMGQERGR